MAFNNMANTHLKKTIENKKKETSSNSALEKRIAEVSKIEEVNRASGTDIMRKAAEAKVDLAKVRPTVQKVTDRDGYDSRVRSGYTARNDQLLQDAWDEIKDPYTREELKGVSAELERLHTIQNMANPYITDIEGHRKIRNTAKSAAGRNGYVYDEKTSPLEINLRRAEERLNKFYQSQGFADGEELKRAIEEKETERNRLRWQRKGISMESVANPDSENYDSDFEKKAVYVSPFKDRNNPTLKESFSYTEDKRLYDYINDVDGSRSFASARLSVDDSGYDILNAGYEYMTDTEKKLYNYYYNQQGADKARDYLHTIKEDLGARRAKEDFKKYEGNTFKEVMHSVPAGLDQAREGMKNAFNTKDTYIPVNSTQQLSGMIREDLPDLARVVYDLGKTTSNMAPSILASATLNMIAPGTGVAPIVGTGMMGVSAAGNAYQDKLNQGWNKDSARVYSTGIGVAEGSMQYLLGGIGKLGGKISGKTITSMATGIDNALGRFAFKWGAKMASEGLEESLQEVISPFMENLALGYAKNSTADINWGEVAYSGLLGALSAGLFEGVGTGTEVFGENKNAKYIGVLAKGNQRTGDILDAASKAPAGSEAQILFKKYESDGINEENISDLQLGRLFLNTQAAAENVLNSKKATEIEKAQAQEIQKQLSEINKFKAGTNSTESVINDSESGTNTLESVINDIETGNRLTDNDLEEYLNAGERKNRSKLKFLEEGKKIILTSADEITNFIRNSIEGVKGLVTVGYGRVSNRLSQDVENFSNGKIKIAGSFLELVPYDIKHAYTEHHTAKQEGDIDLTEKDFENIPDYIDNYDELVYARTYKSGNTRICISKRLPNGRVIIIEGVSKSRGSLEFKNMIGVSEEKYNKEYKNRSSSNTRGSKSSTISLRDDTASIDSIFDNGEKVNKNNTESGTMGTELDKVVDEGVRYKIPENDTSGEISSIKEQLRQNSETLDNRNVVASVNATTKFNSAKEALSWAVQTLKRSGYKAERQGWGTVIFDEKRLSNALRYLNTEAEYVAYSMIPKIIKQGIIVGEHQNHKNRGYDTVTFAAPVEINGVRGNMAVAVRMDGKNYYKIHRVLMPNGGLFEFNEKSSTERAAATTSVVDTPANTASTDSIFDNGEKVNKNNSGIVADKMSARFGVRNPEEYRGLNAIGKRLGVKVVLEELVGKDGYYDSKTKELHINIYAQKPMEIIKKHEITHILEGTEKYDKLVVFAKENMAEEWSQKEEEITDLYERVNKKRLEDGMEAIELTPKRLESEVMAELAERFVSDETLDMISREKPSLMEKVIDFIREIVSKLKGVISGRELSVYEQAEQKWLAAYDVVKEKGTVYDEDVEYKFPANSTFAEQVDAVVGGANTTDTHLKVSDTTPKLLLDLGLEDKPILITSVHTKTALGYEVKNKNIHNIRKSVFKQLPKLIESPAIVMQSTKPESIVMFVNALDEHKVPILCSISINGVGRYNNVEISTNIITSVYGKDTNPTGFIRKAINENRLLYWNKKMSQELFDSPGLQLPDEINNFDSNVIIRKISEKVNNVDKNNTDTKKYKIQDPDAGVESFAEYVVRVETENATLKKANEKLRKQMGMYDVFNLNPARINKIASVIRAEYKSSMSVKDIATRLQEIAERFVERNESDGGEISQENYEKIFYEFAKIGEEVAGSSTQKDTTLYDTYKDLITTLRETAIYISEEDAKNIPDYNAFRKSVFGKIRISKNAGLSVDSFYEELLEQYPGMFDASITHPADRLLEIAKVRETLSPKLIDIDVEQAGLCIAAEAMNKIFTNTAEEDQTIVEAVKNGFLKEYREERKAREDRLLLLKLAKEFKKMRTTPENLEKIPDIVNQLDTMGISILEKGFTKADGTKVMGRLDLQELKKQYHEAKAKDADGNDIFGNAYIEKKIERLDRKQISDMDIADVRDLIETLRALKHEIMTAKKLLGEQREREVHEIAKRTVSEFRSTAGVKNKKYVYDMQNKYNTMSLTPERQARRMVGYDKESVFVKIVEALTVGERKKIAFLRETEEFFREVTKNEKEMSKFSNEKLEIPFTARVVKEIRENGEVRHVEEIEERKITLTPAMRISLYLHSKDVDNLRHIANGGIVIPDFDLYKKGKFSESYNTGASSGDGYVEAVTLKLTPAQVKKIVSGMTEFEMQFAEVAYKWLNGNCKKALNQTSLALLGYEVARKNNYMPIQTDPNFTKKDFAVQDGTLEGMGMLKERQHGTNPILLVDILRVIEQQKEKVGGYYGLAIPLRNFKLVWNSSLGFSDSVKMAANNMWGDGAGKYFENLIVNLEGTGEKSLIGNKAIANIKGNYASYILSLNPKSAMKQLSGYPVAAGVYGPGPLIKALGKRMTAEDKEIMNKYSPLIWYRMQGYMMSELGDYVAAQDTINKKYPKLLGWLQKIDTAVCEKMWMASQIYVDGRLGELNIKKGTEVYWKRVAEMFHKGVEETQANYSVMQRPDILKNSNAVVKGLLMFKTQPFQNFNMVFDAVGEYRAAVASKDNKWIKESGKTLQRVMSSQVVAALMSGIIGVAIDLGLYRKKDDEEESEFSWIFDVMKNAMGELMGAAAFGDYAWNVIDSSFLGGRWFDATTLDANVINDLASRVINVCNTVTDAEKNKDIREYIKILGNIVDVVGQLTGMPTGNFKKIIKGLGTTAFDAANFAGLDTTRLEYEFFRISTPLSKKSEYGNYLSKIINNARETSYEEMKNARYKSAMKVADDMRKLFGRDYVDNILKKPVSEIKKARKENFSDMIEGSHINGKLTPETELEIKRYDSSDNSSYDELSDALYNDEGAIKLTYGAKEFVLTPVQEVRYLRLAEQKQKDGYARLIEKGDMVNSVLYGKPASELSDKEKDGVVDYFNYMIESGEMTLEEAQKRFNYIKSGKQLAPTQFAYYYKDLTFDEMTDAQKDSTLEYYNKKYNSGEMSYEEVRSCLDEIKAGTMTKRFKTYYPDYYSEMTEDEKRKIINKIKSMSKDYAKAQMKSELVMGE